MRLKSLQGSIDQSIPAQEIEIKYTPSTTLDPTAEWHYLDDQGVKLPIKNQQTLNYAIRNRFKIVQ